MKLSFEDWKAANYATYVDWVRNATPEYAIKAAYEAALSQQAQPCCYLIPGACTHGFDTDKCWQEGAQQAQPLTDEMIEAEIARRYNRSLAPLPVYPVDPTEGWVQAFRCGAKWARDFRTRPSLTQEERNALRDTLCSDFGTTRCRLTPCGCAPISGLLSRTESEAKPDDGLCLCCGKSKGLHLDDGRCWDDNNGGVGRGWYSMRYKAKA